jgi:hypothetical protein
MNDATKKALAEWLIVMDGAALVHKQELARAAWEKGYD